MKEGKYVGRVGKIILETVPKKMRLANKDVNRKKSTILIQIA